jgi:GT2 family glycosyltransferase
MSVPTSDARTDETARISVVLAAFDMGRWELLRTAVESVQRENRADVQIVLAVDNNEALYARAARELPGVDVVHNTGERGASTTRNAGAAVATGQLLAFLDDDARAEPGWLSHLMRPLTDSPDVIGVGGAVAPAWQTAAPRWFPMEFGWVVGASYTGLPSRGAPVRNVWSENMAVRVEDFRGVGGFREGFGKVGNASRPEDTEFCVRIQSRHPGSHWWYEPAALVHHAVPGERANLRFFLRRCYSEGRGKAALAVLVGSKAGMSAERSHVTRVLPLGVLRGLRDAGRGDVWGLSRAAAIVAGTAAAAWGFVHERHLANAST